MASKYLDIPSNPTADDVVLSDSSTTNNAVQIAFDTTMTTGEIYSALKTVADVLASGKHTW